MNVTFAVHVRDNSKTPDIDPRPFFTKTVEVRTGRVSTTVSDNVDPLVIEALALHFNDQYCIVEGLSTLDGYLKGESGNLHRDDKLGQATFYSDLEELTVSEEFTVCPGSPYYFTATGQVDL